VQALLDDVHGLLVQFGRRRREQLEERDVVVGKSIFVTQRRDHLVAVGAPCVVVRHDGERDIQRVTIERKPRVIRRIRLTTRQRLQLAFQLGNHITRRRSHSGNVPGGREWQVSLELATHDNPTISYTNQTELAGTRSWPSQVKRAVVTASSPSLPVMSWWIP